VGASIVADFKTALKALSKGDLDFDAVSNNLTKLLNKQPQLAISIMEQVCEAYGEDLIDATNYARLKERSPHIRMSLAAHRMQAQVSACCWTWVKEPYVASGRSREATVVY